MVGNYGISTTCQLCEQNHPTYADAIACADIVWRGHTPPTVLASPIPDHLPADIVLIGIDLSYALITGHGRGEERTA